VAADWQKERQQADDQWQYRLQRAEYEADRARRQYNAVEPENRLVCRTLELEWEQKLRAHRELQEAYERFQQDEPKVLTLAEQDAIRRLAADVPAIWHAATTTDTERKGILRQILDKVVIQIEGQSEWIEARLHWAGGHETYTRFRRPVAKLTQLSEWPELQQHILALKAEGRTAQEIAEQLNREGRTSPHLKPFTASTIRAALSRRGLTEVRRGTSAEPIALIEGERFASELARELGVRPQIVYAWIKSGRLSGRQAGGVQGRWIVRADASVMAILKAPEEGPTGQNPTSKTAQV
jgi:DNA-binding NarL/FixJ family response regulator